MNVSRGSQFVLTVVALVALVLSPGDAGAEEKWFGTAPFCRAKKSTCAKRGMTFVRESKTGDGKKCVSGRKVLCRGFDQKYVNAKWRGWST